MRHQKTLIIIFSLIIVWGNSRAGFAREFPPDITAREKQGILYYRKSQYYHARDKFIEVIVENNQNKLAKDYLDKIGRIKNTLTNAEQHRIMQFLSIVDHMIFLRKQIRDVSFKNHDLMKFVGAKAGNDPEISKALQSTEKSMNDVDYAYDIEIDLKKYYAARRYDLAEILKVLKEEKNKLSSALDEIGRINSNLRAMREEILNRLIK